MKVGQRLVTRTVSYLLLPGLLCFFAAVSAPLVWGQPAIASVNVLNQSNATGATKLLVVEIVGTGLLPNPLTPPTVIVVPGVLGAPTPVNAPSDTSISAQFTVPQNYQLSQVALSYPAGGSISKDVTTPPCRDSDIINYFNFVSNDKVKNTFGNGVAKSFHVVKLSIVNKCSQGIVVPLAGITLTPTPPPSIPGPTSIAPYSLSQVTAVYSTDRKLTGTRAICFNIIAALATLGSAVQPYFGPGFAQGVAILGGGFTQAANTIFKDLSAEQLQNIAALSFGDSEQISPNGGPVNKYLFLPRVKKPEADPFLTCAKRDANNKSTACNKTPIDGTVTGNLTWATVNTANTGAITPGPAAPAPAAPAPVAPAPAAPLGAAGAPAPPKK